MKRSKILYNSMRRLFMLLACVVLFCAVPSAQAAEASGTCGDNLTWSLSGDVLTITGSGAMYDYPESTMAPWYDYRSQISTVILPDGLTRVGDLAFYGCTALRAVTLPNSVKEVGWFAFASCTGLQILDLGSGLRVIEQAGFRECTSLSAVRLPNSLTSIGFQAFYRCESLTEITIPASVTDMGMTAFAYCYSLVRASVYADIALVPDWTFYGCARLTDVYLSASIQGAKEDAFGFCTSLASVSTGGSTEAAEQIKADIDRDLGGGTGLLDVSGNELGESTSSTTFTETEDSIVSETITTVETDNASVSAAVEVVYPGGSVDQSQSSAQISVTLETAQGWDEVSETVSEIVGRTSGATVNTYIKDDSALPGSVVSGFAGQDVTVSVYTASGTSWQVDCTSLTQQDQPESYDFSYTRDAATAEQLELLGCTVGYQITFESDAVLNAVVRIKLPAEYARQSATLCQLERKNKLTQLQTVLIDDEGYAHFYLANVDADTTYLIGIAVPAAAQTEGDTTAEPIIPETLYDAYGVTNVIRTLDYVTTGRASSWGISFGQVTWIMIGAMVVVVIAVGTTMFALNKRKLKAGYIPDLDEE